MLIYFINFYKQASRGVLLKIDPENIRESHRKASVVESFFSPVKLLA